MFGVVYMWFGANMAGRRKNMFKFCSSSIDNITKTTSGCLECGLEWFRGGLGLFGGGLGCFH